MMHKQKYAVWLTHAAALAFLGIDTAQPQSRWVVLGEYIGDELAVGLWLRVDHIEQWMAIGQEKSIVVTPPDCLIPWHYVVTVQALGKYEDLKVTGFGKQ